MPPSKPLTLKLLSGPVEVRRAHSFGGKGLDMGFYENQVAEALAEAVLFQGLAAADLLACKGIGHPSPLVVPALMVTEILNDLRWGHLVLVRPGAGEAESTDRFSAAYTAFAAHFGRSFRLSGRDHRLVFREGAEALQREADLDMVPAAEATAIVQSICRGLPALSPHLDLLATSMLDFRAPLKQEGFVLLREALGYAARARSQEEVFTPAQLRRMAAKDWIEIQLLDEDGNPWIGAFELVLPGGGTREITVDETGFARIEHIMSGTCEFTLIDP